MDRRSVVRFAGAWMNLLTLAAAGVESPADAGRKRCRRRRRRRNAQRRPNGRRVRYCEGEVAPWQPALGDCREARETHSSASIL